MKKPENCLLNSEMELPGCVVVSYVFPKCIIKSTTQNNLLLNKTFVHPH